MIAIDIAANPRILLNTGLTRPFTCIAPEGTVLNPVHPAAVGRALILRH